MYIFIHFGMGEKFMKQTGAGQTTAMRSPWCLPLGLFYDEYYYMEKILP